ncbi:MAG: hypothetical protein ACHQ1D_00140 [Nitrososphaerales archaeon]
MKNILLYILLSFLFFDANATKRFVASTAEDADISSAIATQISAASTLDTVVLPPGNYKIGSNIDCSKAISFLGSQSKIPTVLYVASTRTLTANDYMLEIDVESATLRNITVSYITFKSKNPSITPNDGGDTIDDFGLRIVKCNGFIVHHCNFYYFGDAGLYVSHYDTQANGLITQNNFIECAKTYNSLLLGYGVVVYADGAPGVWASVTPGSSNSIFIENNYFIGCRHAVASNYGSLYTARYNTVQSNLNSSAFDAHESPATNEAGSRLTEIYNNVITNEYFPITRFANSAARAAFAPFHAGDHYAVQEDTRVTYVSTGTSAGNWAVATLPISTKNGSPIYAFKNYLELTEIAIRIRGGEALIFNNRIRGFKNGIDIIDNYHIDVTYPINFGIGYASQLNYNSSHTGTDAAHGEGDLFYWNNDIDIYNSSCKVFDNLDPTLYTIERDYHSVKKPGYVPYIYPHPYNSFVK